MADVSAHDGLGVAWASSHHGNWVPTVNKPSELDRALSPFLIQSWKSHNVTCSIVKFQGESTDPILKGRSVGTML